MQNPPQVCAIPSIDERDYYAILGMVPDEETRGELCSHDFWIKKCERIKNEMARRGVTVHEINVTPDMLRAWCSAQKVEPTFSEAAQIASFELAKRLGAFS